ncbi:TadE/TadG family type IV pilus assembly protein [Dongia sp.]|uniref:TadE/TadG family type IV pilus assembly protein n=1 Tax=Dongia sp. TaxID=1977262 RepID=UPI0035B434B3
MRGALAWLGRWRRCDSGSPVVEFALLAPMLMLLACGLIDFGLAVRAKSQIEGAARAGLQKGFGNMWDAEAIAAAAKNAVSTDAGIQESLTVDSSASCYCDGVLTASGDDCTKSTTCGGGGYPDFYLTVDVSERHEMLLDYYLFPSELNIASSATARAQP